MGVPLIAFFCFFMTQDSDTSLYYDASWTFNLPVTAYTPTVSNLITGHGWMDRNLGASQVATSRIDVAAFGDLYQWGRYSDGHEHRASDTSQTIATTYIPNAGNSWDAKFILELVGVSLGDWVNPQENSLWQGANGLNNVCPDGFRIPTEAEWEAERQSWSSNDAAGAFASPLKLTQGGERHLVDGEVGSIGFIGGYWSAAVDGQDAKSMTIYKSNAYLVSDNRAYGHSVRCIKN